MSPPNDGERGAGRRRNGRGRAGEDDPGILSNLPRTRPQRSSRASRGRAQRRRRRGAEHGGCGAANGRAPAASKPARALRESGAATRSKAARTPAKRPARARVHGHGAQRWREESARARERQRAPARAAAPPASTAQPTAPRQGFECEGERASADGAAAGRRRAGGVGGRDRRRARQGGAVNGRAAAQGRILAPAALSPSEPSARPPRRGHGTGDAICILPRNAEPLRLRSRRAGDPMRIEVDPLGRIGPTGP